MNGEEILPPTGTTVEDGDGNSYGIIRIGRQYWMDENLHTTKYNDGTAIAHITDGKEWMAAIEGAYCSYDNDDANAARYGLLYNRAAVSTHKLCPEGWHVPTVDDWNKLGSALGGTLNDFDSWGRRRLETQSDGRLACGRKGYRRERLWRTARRCVPRRPQRHGDGQVLLR